MKNDLEFLMKNDGRIVFERINFNDSTNYSMVVSVTSNKERHSIRDSIYEAELNHVKDLNLLISHHLNSSISRLKKKILDDIIYKISAENTAS